MIVSVPFRVPAAVGGKTTLIVQLALGERIEPQVLDWLKSPDTVIPVTLKEATPMLVKTTDWAVLDTPIGWPANPRLATETEAWGVGLPAPEREINCGLFAALSVNVTEPKRLPDTVGVNVTLMVQLAAGA